MFLFVSLSLLVDICRHGRRKVVVLRHLQTSHGGRLFDSGIGRCGLDQEGENSSVAATKGSQSKDSQREFFGVVASCWSGMGRLSVHVDTFPFVPSKYFFILQYLCSVYF